MEAGKVVVSRRYHELDALRGIAALIVILFHFSLTYPASHEALAWEGFISKVGPGSVILFFVLSGFVLALSLKERSGAAVYGAYYVRRVLRLYPIYILATTAVFFIKYLFLTGPISSDYVSAWYNIGWKIPVSVSEYLKILTLVLDFDTWALDGPSWTLVYEMRISLIMPFLMWAFKKQKYLSLLALMAIGWVGDYVDSGIPRIDVFYAADMSLSNYMGNLMYMAYFALGMFFAFTKDSVMRFVADMPLWGRIVLLMVSLAFYANRLWLVLSPEWYYCGDLLTAFGSVGLMAFVMQSRVAEKLFGTWIFQTLGKISYGIYLWHLVMLFLFVALFIDTLSLEWIFAITMTATLVLSWITYYAVEMPFIKMGRTITKIIMDRYGT